MGGFRLSIDNGYKKLCYECYDEIAKKQKLINPGFDKDKMIQIVPKKECENCGIKTIKINLDLDKN